MKEIPLGLYIYPVLQSADILLYKSVNDNLRYQFRSNVIIFCSLTEPLMSQSVKIRSSMYS